MKKILSIIMSLLCALSFALFAIGCKTKTPNTPSGNEQPGETPGGDPGENPGGDPGENPGGEPEEPIEEKLEITGPTGDVYGYRQKLREYLTAEGEDVKVSDYVSGGKESEAYDKISITWTSTCENIEEYVIELSVNEDFSNAESWTMPPTSRRLNVYNLYKSTTYYVRVTAVKDGDDITDTFTFRTTDIGPRVMKIDGLCNVRDLGGYTTASGKTTLQGKIFRGGQLSPNSNFSVYDNVALTASGKKYMSETLGIKTDFDLRNAAENKGLTESPIPGANLEYYSAGGYLSAFTDANAYRNVFSALADENRYPVYVHCTGGADRTGTVSFLFNALLGVDEKTLIQDYETTSFSIFEMRNKENTTYQFMPFLNKLKSDYEGDTLAEKTENYLLSIGVTETEIYNIKAIMFGEQTKPLPQTVTLNGASDTYVYDTVTPYDGTVAETKISGITDDGNGGTFFFIGSYGVYYRGGLFRLATVNNGNYAEVSPRVSLNSYDKTAFDSGVTFGLSVTIKDENTVTLKLFIDGKEFNQIEVTRTENEIPSNKAKAVVKISQYVTKLTLIKG